jgi:hypothetical protein
MDKICVVSDVGTAYIYVYMCKYIYIYISKLDEGPSSNG